ncbi:RICIN domain-containing protein [Kitasatospora sp. NPDC049285]|uniref:RICIN domain-containing protein n=1 Tax=Kitasatospora sp. NPDC049285 TaxID=3157096 RepID=UPI00342CF055
MPGKKKTLLLTSLLAVATVALGVGDPAVAAGVDVTVANASQFTDASGKAVQAHGGGVIKVGGYYYLFGEDRNADNTFHYVSVYRSKDLKTWQFRRHVLTQATNPELASANIERPKVIFNSTTGEFVMWMHKENSTDYGEARAAVATSKTVDGDYAWQGSFRPLGDQMSRDITLFKDDDGTAYMISASNENRDLHVYRLSADYKSIDAQVQNLWVGQSREAPAMFKRNGVYFLLTSGATGWSPNQQKYGTATSVTGHWSDLKDVGDSTTFGSQTAYVLPVQGTASTDYLYLGDRWGNSFGGMVNDSRYVWLPLAFPTATTLSMEYFPEVAINAARGTVSGVGGPWETLSAGHSGKCVDLADWSTADGAKVDQWGCNWGLNQQYWFKDTGGGAVQLVNRYSGKCASVDGASTEDGAKVVQNTCDAASLGQLWKPQSTGTAFTLVASVSGKCLDVADKSTGDGAALIQWACNGGANQTWTRTTA